MEFKGNNKTFNLKLSQDGKQFVFDFTRPFRDKKIGIAKKPFNLLYHMMAIPLRVLAPLGRTLCGCRCLMRLELK